MFAIGDVITGPMLAHKASEDAEKVAEIIAHNIHSKSDPRVPVSVQAVEPALLRHYDYIPSVVYTSPEVGWVGMTQEAAIAKYGVKNVGIGKFPFSANGRSKTCRETDGFVKLIVEKPSNKLLGAHIIHVQGGELLSELSLAVTKNMTADDIISVCHAHPTFSEAIKEAALDAMGRPLHI